jgi:putative transcriptional regulator
MAQPAALPPASGRLLVSTPLLTDPNFTRTVIYLLEHDGGGTVGVVINRPSRTPVGQVLPNWHDAISEPPVVFAGGPVQPDGALCLGRLRGPGRPAARQIVEQVATIDLDGEVTEAAAATSRLRVFAGHAGWAPGQLERELAERAWWVLPGSPDDLFDESPRALWARVLRRQGSPLNIFSTYSADPLLN